MRKLAAIVRRGSTLLSEPQRQRIRRVAWNARLAYVRRFRSYGADELLSRLRDLGVASDGVVFVHSSYSPLNGFRGSPALLIATLQQAVGPQGTLLMPSSPYTGSTEQYLEAGETFDVRRTPSQMGLVSEIFRRQKGTHRSLNPAHPILARGRLSSWFVEGHESCVYSCGPGSPFEKMVEADARALFFDVELSYLMFFHYLEHLVSDTLPISPYNTEVHPVRVIDPRGHEMVVPVRSFSRRVRMARRFAVLDTELRSRGMVQVRRLGNTVLSLVKIRDTVMVTRDLASRGRYFYEFADTDHGD